MALSYGRGTPVWDTWTICRTSSSVRLCWELEESYGPEGCEIDQTLKIQLVHSCFRSLRISAGCAAFRFSLCKDVRSTNHRLCKDVRSTKRKLNLQAAHQTVTHISTTVQGLCSQPGEFSPQPFFFFTLVTGPRRSLSLKLSDTRVYQP